MAENKNTMEVNKTEATEETQVAEVKKPVLEKVKDGAAKVWSKVKTPLIIGGSLLAGAAIALTGVAYERAMNQDYDPEPEYDPEEPPIEGEYEEVPESE